MSRLNQNDTTKAKKNIPGLEIPVSDNDSKAKWKNIRYIFNEDYINEGHAFCRYFQNIQKNCFIYNIIENIEDKKESCDLYSEVPKENLSKPINFLYEPLPVEDKNPKIHCASKLVALQESPEKGRHFVAAEPIPKNKVLISELPMLLQINPQCGCSGDKEAYISSYRCHHCGVVSSKDRYRCEQCSVCVFCTKKCLKMACQSYHRFECYGLGRHFWSTADTDYSYLALRMMIYGAANDFVTEPKNKECYGNNDNNYPFIYDLETNFFKLSVAKLDKVLYSAARNLMYLMLKTDFFEQYKRSDWHLEQFYLYIGKLLVRHYCQALTNNVLLKYLSLSNGCLINLVGGAGKAICPTVALFNHSCTPNAVIIPCSKYVIVKSLKPIQQGDEITVCYSEIHCFLSVAERHIITEEIFYFTCKCSFCTFEKSMMEAPYKCPKCDKGNAKKVETDGKSVGVCLNCEHRFSMDEIERNLKVAAICKNLCQVTYSIEHLTRVAECYSNVFPARSAQLLNVYKLLYEKHILWGEKPLDVMKYGMLLFNIVQQCTSRLYLPLLVSKVKFFAQIVEMNKFSDIKIVSTTEFETIRYFVREVDNVLKDLTFYLPNDKLNFFKLIRTKVCRMFENIVVISIRNLSIAD